jgi:hypothetical protein
MDFKYSFASLSIIYKFNFCKNLSISKIFRNNKSVTQITLLLYMALMPLLYNDYLDVTKNEVSQGEIG